MGNSSSSPSAFATGTIFKNKEDLVRAANEHNHGVGKLCRVYRSQNSVLHIVCVDQYQNMWKTDRLNTQERKLFVAGGGDRKLFQKKEYESVCCGFIKAHPVKKKKLSLHNTTGAFCLPALQHTRV